MTALWRLYPDVGGMGDPNDDWYGDPIDQHDEGTDHVDQERSHKELALEAAIAANPDQEHYYFAITETGEHVQIDPNTEMCTAPDAESEPFLKRFMSGSRTRRDFTKTVAKVGFAGALAAVFLKAKSASAYQCWWQDDGLRACLSNNCTQNNYRGKYKEEGYYCCNPSCHYTGSYRWTLLWCGCP